MTFPEGARNYIKKSVALLRRSSWRKVSLVLMACLFVLIIFRMFGIGPHPAPPQSSAPPPNNATSSSSGATPTSTDEGASPSAPPSPSTSPAAQVPPSKSNVFLDTFNSDGTLYESANSAMSTSPYWWLDSGAKLILSGGVAHTVEGSLSQTDPWFINYSKNNPQDTDGGYHPQNIFRLVTKGSWTNYIEEAYFKIDALNLSASPNRNESNGLLLFNRYENGDNLYYAGIRVDGAAVIKKKINGTYYQMAYQKIFSGAYDPVKSPNLLPINIWIGIRTVVTNNASGGAVVKLYTDIGKTGKWMLVLQATDSGTVLGGSPFIGAGRGGIRTDFMDVEFDNFKVTSL